MIDLSERKILVTGGSRGIGAACCRLFADAGASLWVHFRAEKQAAESVVASLGEAIGVDHRSSQADLADRDGIEALLAEVQAEWGSLDAIINNAGIWTRNPIGELDQGELDRTWAVNVTGVFQVVALGLPLLSGDDPSIVNITSTAGQRGEAFHSPYAASKGALIAATKSWATELAPRVRVNSVAPGWVDTDMSEGAYSAGGRKQIEASIPLRRIASAEDIAGAVLFLTSPLARHITGEIVNVNGGSVLCG